MIQTFKKTKKSKTILVLLVLLFVFILPVSIGVFYGLNRRGILNTQPTITEGVAYIIYIAILTFLCTLILSLLNYWQNRFAERMLHRQQELERYRLRLEIQPTVLVHHWSMRLGNDMASLKINYIKGELPDHLVLQYYNASLANSGIALEIRLINTSNTFLMFTYKSASVLSGETENALPEQSVNHKVCLDSNQEGTLILGFNEDTMLNLSGNILRIYLVLENRFGEKYVESFELAIREVSKKSENLWSYDIIPQNYSLKKVTGLSFSDELLTSFTEPD